jgi:CBS domain-containing protein
MTCKDIMTPNPSCCLPSDSVSIAAQIMRRNDVGPVLVVSDHEENRLVGIVTDRDLALKVIADGRDPHSTRVDEVMSLHPVCCRSDESTQKALQLMADHQVRRIPIVDMDDRLVGIVAQADVARTEDEEDVGRMVEQISEPYGSSSWTEVRGGTLAHWPSGGSFALGSLCMGIGAGLMYVLDSSRGQSKSPSLSSSAHNRETRGVSDRKLASAIRSRISGIVSYPQALQLKASNGNVTMSGQILADEVRELIDCVTAMDGVRSLESRLEVHDYPGSHPALEGRRHGGGTSGTSSLSLLAGVAAGGLLLYGLRSKIGSTLLERDTVHNRRGETPGY